MAKSTSQHILGTSANLLGFCLFVITSLHVSDSAESTLIDEFTSVIALLLTISTFFSYTSIRTVHPEREMRMEKVADYFFIVSLLGIAAIILLLVFHFVQ
ncbi:MAG: hypothetical protein IPO60_03910 [Flavobacteriales bacterium]|jgi:hypothetical protein|nr:hypothetical protein [Flavobacteriales bacterium]MBK6892308.1 hypothetical protein [Flavobacteriales bacterium]MBK7246443.1 hypothetical protein [Flavobacteriales bacterium]MBK7285962.1 hypothetical protein [Flavobacteriales bacterium]MBK9060616.1 hypothetical protein [Flavobacteriales bacterium]